MLFTVHLTIFTINLFIESFRPWNWEVIDEIYPSSDDTNFNLWVIVFLELHSVENRVYG
jgi:hypothetical protein